MRITRFPRREWSQHVRFDPLTPTIIAIPPVPSYAESRVAAYANISPDTQDPRASSSRQNSCSQPTSPAASGRSQLTALVTPRSHNVGSMTRSLVESFSSLDEVSQLLTARASEEEVAGCYPASMPLPVPLGATVRLAIPLGHVAAVGEALASETSPYRAPLLKNFRGRASHLQYIWYSSAGEGRLQLPPAVPPGLTISPGSVFLHNDTSSGAIQSWISSAAGEWVALNPGDCFNFQHAAYVYSLDGAAPSWALQSTVRKRLNMMHDKTASSVRKTSSTLKLKARKKSKQPKKARVGSNRPVIRQSMD
ncbi:hypothetical protein NMY22_g19741 [Coprinellus aureogranulatus]|nr:hypothetical protein NMY22_g19741 [Coprinellus aureogranulatus]